MALYHTILAKAEKMYLWTSSLYANSTLSGIAEVDMEETPPSLR